MPWPRSFCFLFPLTTPAICPCSSPKEITRYVSTSADLDADKAQWSAVADTSSIAILVMTLSTVVLDAGVRFGVGGYPVGRAGLGNVQPYGQLGVLGGLWLQSLVPFLQLTILVALTRDGLTSRASAFLRHVWLQFLGTLSMCIYLVHWPVIFYLCWALNDGKSVYWPETMDCSNNTVAMSPAKHEKCVTDVQNYLDARTLPGWGIPVVIVITLILSLALFHIVEEPCRKFFRAKSK